jgi:hypothetical protein
MKFNKILPAFPFPQHLIPKIFQEKHAYYLEQFPAWSLTATRRKLIGSYWLKIIINHFLILLIAGMLVALILNDHLAAQQFLLALMPASIVIFFVLFFAMYLPDYQLEFLPHLDNCVESFHAKKLESIQQCKKEQYSVFTLVLIQYCYQEMAGINNNPINNQYAILLARQYGVSAKSILPSLQAVILGQWDRKSIRKRTVAQSKLLPENAMYIVFGCAFLVLFCTSKKEQSIYK